MDPRLLLSTLGEVPQAVPAEIAARTGVDEDQVAEALEALANAGLVARERGHAFRLPPPTEDEARELYVVSLLLEGLALRTAPPFGDDELAALRAANDALLEARDEDAATAADDEFHRLLVAGCGNDRLIEQHAAAKAALLRYERTYFDDAALRARSHGEHAEVVEALADRDHLAAAAAVRRNFESSLPDVARALDAHARRVDSSGSG